jgi:lipopolysaccharide/colanic/teichoic acid biosynthesis glycosyltransferase
MKRIFDIAMSFAALALLSPLIAGLAAFVAIRIGYPVLFVQERAGFHGRCFRMYKFRTMTNARDPSGALLPDADRLTPAGQFLRRSSLDELPSLWNIFAGDMSVVGPRPLLMRYLTRYSQEQARRHNVRPGLTGLAQISGRNALSWEQKFALDTWYVDHATLTLDMLIVLRTFRRVFDRTGIASADNATMGEFMGSQASTETNPIGTDGGYHIPLQRRDGQA